VLDRVLERQDELENNVEKRVGSHLFILTAHWKRLGLKAFHHPVTKNTNTNYGNMATREYTVSNGALARIHTETVSDLLGYLIP
jgi:hypothetical protein